MSTVFFMAKLTNEQRIEIYDQRLKGESLINLALEFNINIHRVKYQIKLLNKDGYDILRNGKNRYYSKKFKEFAVMFIAINIRLSSNGILYNWIKNIMKTSIISQKNLGREQKL